MRFRTRLLITLTGTVVLPVALLSWFVLDNMTLRLQTEHGNRVDAMVLSVQQRFQDYTSRINDRLESLGALMRDDNRLRSSLASYDGSAHSIDSYLIDFGERQAQLAGLTYFQVQDKDGVILTSGHFRSEYGRREKHHRSVRKTITGNPYKPGILNGRTPERAVLALTRSDSVFIAGEPYYLLAGFILDPAFLRELNPAANFFVCLEDSSNKALVLFVDLALCNASQTEIRDPGTTSIIEVSFADNSDGSTSELRFRLVYSMADLELLLSDLDRWFLGILGIILTLGLISIVWASGKISEPLSELLYKTTRINLNRLNISFKTRRKDEVGDLSRVLDELIRRLIRDAASLRIAERRLAIGELARQVNHDIKNALAPIRNIVRHYASLAHTDADELAEIVRDREASLDASITYLEQLAGNYAKLSPKLRLSSLDLDQLITRIVQEYSNARGVKIALRLTASCSVDADPIAFRRILENILDNAFDSLKGGIGTVGIDTELTAENDRETTWPNDEGEDADNETNAQIVIYDTGVGMNPEKLENAFKDFYTTKPGGTGLGLSIVRRLMMDLSGSVHLDSSPGKGTRVTITVPARRR